MVYRFADFELDEKRRELRLRGREVGLQPRVLDLLLYLVRNRDRVVGKEELLETLWSDVIVVDGALQRAMSLARTALQQGGARDVIRTYARHGYRFCGEVECEDDGPASGDVGAPATADAASPLCQARRAYDRGDWEEAVHCFREVDRNDGLTAADLERWAHAGRCAGRETDAVAPLERAVTAHAAVGDRVGAARAALLLTQIQQEQREGAVAQGWLNRAANFLAGEANCREHGLLEWLRSRFAAAEGALEEAARRAEQAHVLGQRIGDADLEALSLLQWGLVRIAQGDIQAGTALQDEAGAAALGEQVSPWVACTVYCGIVWGCRNRADWDRAAQWTEQYDRWIGRGQLAHFPGLCRLHRAEVLGVKGELDEAEREVREACEMLAVNAPWALGDAYRVLGEMRLSCYDLRSAEEAFRRAYELGWDPQPGYAQLHLQQGRADAAVRALERSLADTRWTQSQRRGLLLAHLAIAATAAGYCERATAAMEELDANPDLYATPALAALVERARAEVALCEARQNEAVASLRRSLQAWQEIGAPLHVATLRLRLVEIHMQDGDPDLAELELTAAEAAFRKVGAKAALGACESIRKTHSLGFT